MHAVLAGHLSIHLIECLLCLLSFQAVDDQDAGESSKHLFLDQSIQV